MTCPAYRTDHPIRTAICRNDRSTFNNLVVAVPRVSDSVSFRPSIHGGIFASRRHLVIWFDAHRAEGGGHVRTPTVLPAPQGLQKLTSQAHLSPIFRQSGHAYWLQTATAFHVAYPQNNREVAEQGPLPASRFQIRRLGFVEPSAVRADCID